MHDQAHEGLPLQNLSLQLPGGTVLALENLALLQLNKSAHG